jgi:hypothetical protein
MTIGHSASRTFTAHGVVEAGWRVWFWSITL